MGCGGAAPTGARRLSAARIGDGTAGGQGYVRPIDDLGPPVATHPSPPPGSPLSAGERAFRRLLVNTLITGVTSSFLWFALTFWVYLETRSVVATGVIGGAFSISAALFGPAFGTYVDHHRKHTAMVLATATCLVCFGLATVLFVAVDADRVLSLDGPWFWVFVGVILVGATAGQMRNIALSTCVTMLVPADRRDKANGLVGTVTGVSFAITSVFSGLVIGRLGMGWALYLSLALIALATVHLLAHPHRRADARRRRRRRAPASTSAARWTPSGPCPAC